ncbi:hypothetical protein Aph01nite_58980 [Acrocarpospora phusangensis]|uniref:alpha-amylase n=1 Tax=Acrocarpospora phusangensis TaxID=1070424 RepID=A0A919URK8_9ACTN|nr:hypothetical protein Aph01nite_58980 [Acrocarpospora phusangensis]
MYATSWTTANIHYQPSGGSWTAVPGVAMDETARTRWKKTTIDLAAAAGPRAASDNGSGTWDDSGGETLTAGYPDASNGTVSARFSATVATTWGQNVFLVGNLVALGAWNPANAVPLSAAAYPTWSATLTLPAGATVEYKYLRKNSDGTVTWEPGANRTFSALLGPQVNRTDTWR